MLSEGYIFSVQLCSLQVEDVIRFYVGACSLKLDASEFGSPSSLLLFQPLFT